MGLRGLATGGLGVGCDGVVGKVGKRAEEFTSILQMTAFALFRKTNCMKKLKTINYKSCSSFPTSISARLITEGSASNHRMRPEETLQQPSIKQRANLHLSRCIR